MNSYLQQQFVLSFTAQQLLTMEMIIALLVAVPLGIILKRIGYNMWWALLCFVPALGLPALWLLAFIRWPRDAKGEA